MKKRRIFKFITLVLSVILVLTVAVQTTMAFIVAGAPSVTNTFKPFEAIVNDLLIQKTVEHPFGADYVIPDDIAFDFEVNLGALYAETTVSTTAGDLVADENGVITVTAKPGASVGIVGIDEGTEVTVTELQKLPGFSVKDGVASKAVTVSADGTVTVDFTNVYAPEKVLPTNINITGSKELEGRDWQDGDVFTFLLEYDDGSEEWKSLGERSVTYDAENDGFNRFDFTEALAEVEFTAIGTYVFRMSEIEGDLDRVDYDETVNYFNVTVTDTDMDGKLEISGVTASQNATVTETDGVYTVDVLFNNTFIPVPDDITVDITVKKTVICTGDETISPKDFAFVLENVETGEKLTVKSDENGIADWNLLFTEADAGKTYRYTLSEVIGEMVGVTYDTTVYEIEIQITLSDDNRLIATVTCDGEEVEDLVAEFENSFTAPAPAPTGDDSNVMFHLLIAAISAAALVLLTVYRRRLDLYEEE
ncbi:MAG: hypothetical protein IJX47_00765 [Clostridia bacterium]|nr:hypothetical protein [Clostridia bacterium]